MDKEVVTIILIVAAGISCFAFSALLTCFLLRSWDERQQDKAEVEFITQALSVPL